MGKKGPIKHRSNYWSELPITSSRYHFYNEDFTNFHFKLSLRWHF